MSTSIEAAFQELKGKLRGIAFDSKEYGDYQTVVTIDNGRTRTEPAYVVRAKQFEDVTHTIAFAKKTHLPLTVRGGGHSAAGYCLNKGGIVLDLGLMKAMTLNEDNQTLRVQMGATWSDVYSFVAGHSSNLIPVGGGCLTVGLPGFLLGGGYSFVSRSYGLGSDNVIEIKLVDGKGNLRTLSENATDKHDKDLFWACRGGGGGNFGVAVEMTLKLQTPAAKTILGGQLTFPLDRAKEVIHAYDKWAQKTPSAMAAYGYVGYETDPTDKSRTVPILRITPVYNGEFGDGTDQLKTLFECKPTETRLYSMPLPEWEATFGRSTLVGNRLAYIRSGVIGTTGWTDKMIKALQDYMRSAPSKDSFVVWTHGGGEVDAAAHRGKGPYPHRDKSYIFELKAIWEDPTKTRANVEWAYKFGEALQNGQKGAYVNYIDPLQEKWAEAYYGKGNLSKLRAIKKMADPDNIFHFQQSVDSPYEPKTGFPLDLNQLGRTIIPPTDTPQEHSHAR